MTLDLNTNRATWGPTEPARQRVIRRIGEEQKK